MYSRIDEVKEIGNQKVEITKATSIFEIDELDVNDVIYDPIDSKRSAHRVNSEGQLVKLDYEDFTSILWLKAILG